MLPRAHHVASVQRQSGPRVRNWVQGSSRPRPRFPEWRAAQRSVSLKTLPALMRLSGRESVQRSGARKQGELISGCGQSPIERGGGRELMLGDEREIAEPCPRSDVGRAEAHGAEQPLEIIEA